MIVPKVIRDGKVANRGTRFEISEYDGAEHLRILTPMEGYVA